MIKKTVLHNLSSTVRKLYPLFLVLIVILPGVGGCISFIGNSSNQSEELENLSENNISPILADNSVNISRNFSPETSNHSDLIIRSYNNGTVVEGRLIGPGIPPIGWPVNGTLPNGTPL